MDDLAASVTLVLIASFILLTVLVYMLVAKALNVLDGHLERLQGKVDVLQAQLQKLIDHVM